MFRICNILCFSSVTIATHTHLDVTLYVHYLFVWVLILLSPTKYSTQERKCINIEVLQTAETNIAAFRGVETVQFRSYNIQGWQSVVCRLCSLNKGHSAIFQQILPFKYNSDREPYSNKCALTAINPCWIMYAVPLVVSYSPIQAQTFDDRRHVYRILLFQLE